MRLAGRIEAEDRTRDLLAWHALVTTEYKPGTTLEEILGRAPLSRDTRWDVPDAAPDEADNTQQAWEREVLLAEGHADAGYSTMTRLTPEEVERAYAEAHVR